MNIANKIFKLVVGIIVTGISIVAGAFAVNNGDALLGAVPSNGGFPGIYNATGTDLVLRDGYGSALATDQYGRVIISASSTYGSLIPTSDNANDLGSLTNRWRTGYFGTSVSSTIFIAGPGSASTPSYAVSSGSGFYRNGTSAIGVTGNGTAMFNMDLDNFRPATGRSNLTDLGVTATRFRTLYLGTSQIFSSGATGIQMYNTADETTAFERLSFSWSGNTSYIQNLAGTGATPRAMIIGVGATAGSAVTNFLQIKTNSSPAIFQFNSGAYTGTALIDTPTTVGGSSGQRSVLNINATISQTGTAGYNALLINPTESSTGSGDKNLLIAQAGGTTRFRVDNLGNTTISSAATTGLRFFNTADETTNYERATLGYSSNVFTISTEIGGTGSSRNLQIGANGRFLVVRPSANPVFELSGGSSGSLTENSKVTFTSTLSSGTFLNLSSAPVINQSGTAGYTALLLNPTETATGSGNKRLISGQVGGSDRFVVENTGKVTLDTTVTTGGTTGAQTINKPSGCVNFAAAATSLVVTNSVVSASSIISPSVQTNDSTLKSVQVVPTSGSFTLYANAAATAETKVCFVVYN